MFPLLIPAAIGALGGAMIDKKKPLRGALLGAGLGAGAGAALPASGLLGSAGAAGTAAAGTGAAAAGTGAAAAGGAAGSTAAGSTVAAAAPWADGAGAIVAPAAGSGSGVIGGVAAPVGLLDQANAAMTKYKPLTDAATIGIGMSGALDQQPEQPLPTAPPIMNQGGAEVLAGLASQGGAQQEMQERARRRAMLRGGV